MASVGDLKAGGDEVRNTIGEAILFVDAARAYQEELADRADAAAEMLERAIEAVGALVVDIATEGDNRIAHAWAKADEAAKQFARLTEGGHNPDILLALGLLAQASGQLQTAQTAVHHTGYKIQSASPKVQTAIVVLNTVSGHLGRDLAFRTEDPHASLQKADSTIEAWRDSL